MSNSRIIKNIGDTLIKLLDGEVWGDSESEKFTTKGILLDSPKDIKPDNDVQISLFLYKIMENVYMKNEEPRETGSSQILWPPIALDLMYLVTPYGKKKEKEHLILGRAMQIFHGNTILPRKFLPDDLRQRDEEIKLLFHPLSLDDQTKIWGAFPDIGYKLSVTYMVTPVLIDSTRTVSTTRVLTKELHQAIMTSNREEE